jgi:hypothetical protein
MKIRKMDVSELDFALMFIGQERIDQIIEAVADGAKLELKESGFKDKGYDYTQILVDGMVCATIGGY